MKKYSKLPFLIRVFSYCFVGICPLKVISQTRDTISTVKIKEVVVKAQMHRTDASSSTYISIVKQRASAQNAIDLLEQLTISQISINLMDKWASCFSTKSEAKNIIYAIDPLCYKPSTLQVLYNKYLRHGYRLDRYL